MYDKVKESILVALCLLNLKIEFFLVSHPCFSALELFLTAESCRPCPSKSLSVIIIGESCNCV